MGETRGLMASEDHLCVTLNLLGRHAECIALAHAVITREGGRPSAKLPNLLRLMTAQSGSGAIAEAGQTLMQAMPGRRRTGILFLASSSIAVLLAELGRWADATRVGAAALAVQHRTQRAWQPSLQRTITRWQTLLAAVPCDAEKRARWECERQALDEAAIEVICLRAVPARP